LVDGDTVLYDSKVIAEYIEETHPTPALLPAQPSQRARCRALELRADTETDAAVLALSMFKFFRRGLAGEYPEAARRAEAAVRGHFAAWNALLDGRPFLLGSFSRADLALAPHIGACAFLGVAPDERVAHLAAWLARMNERESIQRTTAEAMAAVGRKYEDPAFDDNRLHWRSDRIEQMVRIGLGPWLLAELAADRAFLPPAPE
jgi:glutathione S-transferase